MTFDHKYFPEFCFDCYGNTRDGRAAIANAILSINYNRNYGIQYTHTAGAIDCVCDVLLTESCGLDPAANCIDVVFITDGLSNDPNRDVCTESRPPNMLCLHNRFGVNTE